MQVCQFTIHLPLPDCIYAFAVWGVLFYRKIRYGYSFHRIKLTQNQSAIVDVEDFQELNQFKWYAIKDCATYYARRTINIGQTAKVVAMHRQVLKYKGLLVIDHINGNGLDNRKANLRIATPAQNSYNVRKITRPCSSKYRGVSKSKQINKWAAYIAKNRKRTHLGFFENEIDAAKAYDKAAKELHGEFARLNFT